MFEGKGVWRNLFGTRFWSTCLYIFSQWKGTNLGPIGCCYVFELDTSLRSSLNTNCLSHCSITVKRPYDQNNSYTRRHLIRGLLAEASRHSAGKNVSGSYFLIHKQRKRMGLAWIFETSKLTPVTHFLQQSPNWYPDQYQGVPLSGD